MTRPASWKFTGRDATRRKQRTHDSPWFCRLRLQGSGMSHESLHARCPSPIRLASRTLGARARGCKLPASYFSAGRVAGARSTPASFPVIRKVTDPLETAKPLRDRGLAKLHGHLAVDLENRGPRAVVVLPACAPCRQLLRNVSPENFFIRFLVREASTTDAGRLPSVRGPRCRAGRPLQLHPDAALGLSPLVPRTPRRCHHCREAA